MDIEYAFESVSTSCLEGQNVAFEFYIEQFAFLREKLSSTANIMKKVINSSMGGFVSYEKANDVWKPLDHS